MNVELLLKVKERILKEPERLRMTTWQDNLACGTVGCIAGHAVLIAGVEAPYMLDTVGWQRLASELFEVELGNELESLLYLSSWPDDFYRAYVMACTDKERAEVVAGRIDVFIAEHGDD